LQVKMAEDIDFKYPTRRACAWEISHFCKGVPHGHARVIRCLQVRGDDDSQTVGITSCSDLGYYPSCSCSC
jgi:Golgi apparatus protein 1